MRYVAVSLVTDRHTHRTTTITLRHMRRGLISRRGSEVCCPVSWGRYQVTREQGQQPVAERVTLLEKTRSENNSPQLPPTSLPGVESMQSQIKQLTDTVNNHQRVLEFKERANRANNIVITGIQEAQPNEDTSTIVSEFLNSRMDITSIKISQARRLGRSQLPTHKPT